MSEVILEQPAEGIAVVKLNRPEVRNALNAAVRQQLADHFTTLGADETTRCIVITGGEKVFAAGADLRDMVDLTPVEMIAR
ncbi:MAG TPA: enoyl-CoA hydratase-related protein, partial [Thermoanaerobaculia bacterium]